MKKFKLLLSIVLFINSLSLIGQSDLKKAPSTKFIGLNKDSSFLISTKPVTNREYLIYILWLYKVYSIDYPGIMEKAIPGMSNFNWSLNVGAYDEKLTDFQNILKHTPNYVKDYVLNPKYIDYPVIGISTLQAMNFCKWLTDRYNENKLIRYGYMEPDSNQFDANNFVTESYLAQQYIGTSIKSYTVKWSDRILIPNFRLPTPSELNMAKTDKSFHDELKSYKYDKRSFHNYWHKFYLKVSSEGLYDYYRKKIDFIHTDSKEFDLSNYNIKELTYEHREPTQVFNFDNFLEIDEKDSLGLMPFIVIDENVYQQPIITKRFIKEEIDSSNTITLYFFRFSGNIKPKQFKP